MTAHVISFLLAFVLVIQLYLLPQSLIGSGIWVIMLIAISIGFYHGIGFEPAGPIRKFLFGPTVGWPLMLWGLYYVASQMGFI